MMINSYRLKPESYFTNISKQWVYWIVVVGITVFYLLTLRVGHDWGGDFSQYIHHAKNLVEGKPYHNILYITNSFAFVSPATYPPVFPIILMPVIAVFGVDLFAMKCVIVIFFTLSLVLLKKIFEHRLTFSAILTLALIVGLNADFYIYKDRILSEFPYLFFSLFSLYLMQNEFSKQRYEKAILLGLLMYLAYGTRDIGITLPLTLVVYEIWHYRRLTVNTLVAISLFAILAVIQWKVMQFETLYPEFVMPLEKLKEGGNIAPSPLSFINLKPDHMWDQFKRYYWVLIKFWGINEYSFGKYLFWLLNGFALTGYFYSLIEKIKVTEIYFTGYFFVLIIFAGFQGVRYLLPILPFYVFYVLFGISRLEYIHKKLSEIILFSFALIILSISFLSFPLKQQGIIERGIDDKQVKSLFAFIRAYTRPDDVLVFRKPRVLSLYTQRRASPYPRVSSPTLFLQYLRAIDTKYLISFYKNTKKIDRLLKTYPNQFFLVYSSPSYKVYQLGQSDS